jgi:hypothetical protein
MTQTSARSASSSLPSRRRSRKAAAVVVAFASLAAISAVRADDARPSAQDAVLSTAESNKDDLVKGAAASRVELGEEQPKESVTPSGAFQ